jgi:hypothetical protein
MKRCGRCFESFHSKNRFELLCSRCKQLNALEIEECDCMIGCCTCDEEEAETNFSQGNMRFEKKGHWQDASGEYHLITKMKIGYIFNCLKLMERKVYERCESRAETAQILGSNSKYRELYFELKKRCKRKKLEFTDFLMVICK